ncbi:MAG: GNAT family N-acetyltransferase, partial [Nitrospinota bacterium]
CPGRGKSVNFTENVRIVPLCNVPFAISVLKELFIKEWEPWYCSNGRGNAEADLLACCNQYEVPMAFVALKDEDQVLGTAALKPRLDGINLDYGPWLGAVLVGKQYRGNGIGTMLINAIESKARSLGFQVIYTSTNSATSILTRRGWISTGENFHSLHGPIPIFCLDLERTT